MRIEYWNPSVKAKTDALKTGEGPKNATIKVTKRVT
jgi:hypothetical protein